MANQYTKAKEQAINERLARQEAAGIPDSKPPIADADAPRESRLAGCHFNGIPVEQLPAEMVAHLRFEVTDEGMLLKDREFQALREAGQVSRIEMESDEVTEKKRFGSMRDALMAGASVEEAENPMQELMDLHLKPGQTGRFMDPETVDQLGPRGYTPVLDDKGNRVTCGQSYLAAIPTEVYEARERRREALNASKLVVAQEQVQEQVGRLRHAEESAGTPAGASGAPLPAGLHISRDLESLPSARQG
jgi:hypothetical protein